MRAAPDDVHLAALVIHRIAVAREAAALELEADQPPGDAALLLRAERVVARVNGAPLSSFTIQPRPASSGVMVSSISLP